MALFIIVSGALLMLSGAASLAYGFEIVVTERGSAMVIGGTVAISGGLIAIGIGFTLLRLSQLLSTLDPRNVRSVRHGVDRPVVPLAEQKRPRQDQIQDRVEQQDIEYEASALKLGPMAAVGGIATAAVISSGLGGAVAADRKEPDSQDSSVTVAPEPVSLEQEIDEELPREPQRIPPEDLEAELARALAETDASVPTKHQESDKGQDLPRFLSKSNNKGRKNRSGEEDAQSLSDPSALSDLTPEDGIVGPEANSPLTVVSDDADTKDDEADQHSEVASETDTVEDAATEKTTSVASGDAATISDDLEHRSKSSQGAQVLGTYNSGGRTYTMYADGTVEAITEQGIQHFASMEELRLHLSGS